MSGAGGGIRTKPAALGRNYWRLWHATVLSNLGDGIGAVAAPWLATSLTRSPLRVAAVAVLGQLPWLLLSLPAGVLVDRGGHRRLLVASDALRCLLATLVAVTLLTGTLRLPLLAAVVFLFGAGEVVRDTAAQTVVPRIVPPARLERANANLWTGETLMNQTLGPWLGGLLVSVAVTVPFFAGAGVFAAAAGLLLLVTAAPPATPAAACGGSLWAELQRGLRFLAGHRLLRSLVLFVAALNLAGGLVMATAVLFAQEVLGVGARGFGALMGMGAVGGFLGAQLTPVLTRRLGVRDSLRGCLAVSAVTYPAVGLLSDGRGVAVLMALGAGAAMVWNVVTVSLRQRIVPPHLLGRVNSVYRLIAWGMVPVGSVLGGMLVTAGEAALGRTAALRLPFLVAGAVAVTGTALAWRRSPGTAWEAAGRETAGDHARTAS